MQIDFRSGDANNQTGGLPNCTNPLWRRLDQHPIAILTVLYVLCVLAFIASIKLPRVDGQLTGSDGAFYYSYLPTLLVDHDLDFANQYAVLVPANIVAKLPRSPSGRLHNKYAVGAAVLWAPFFLAGHCLALALNAAGHPVRLDGVGYIYQIATLLGTISYGFAGILILYRSCRRFFTRPGSVLAVISIWLATNVIYYMIAEPSMSHACSFFATALFLELWLSFRPVPTLVQWMILGLSGGLIALVRQPDVTWLALPALDILLSYKAAGRRNFRHDTAGLLIFGISAILVFLPQFAIWRVLNGTATQTGYAYSGEHFRWSPTHMLELLFSLRHGLYLWHPVLLLATFGLVLFLFKDRSLGIALGLIFISQIGLLGSWRGWYGGNSFGSRMLISSLPILALGLAALIEWMAERRAFSAVFLLAAGFILWNALFFAQYRFGYISKTEPITFRELTVGKFAMLKDLPSRLYGMLR
jgi:hypothetical protein